MAANRRFEQRGRNFIFRAEFAPAGQGRVFREGLVVQRHYRLNFELLRDVEGEVLGEALIGGGRGGLRQVLMNEGIEVADYDLIMAVHSNSFQHVWQQSRKNIPLAEWLSNGENTRARMDQLAKQLNSGEVMNFVDLTFVRRLGRGGKGSGKKCNPGRLAWEKLVEKKRCVIPIKNQDDRCCARAIVTMREWCHCKEPRNQWSNLRQGRPQQGFLPRELHRKAGVPEGMCGYAELEKFQAFLRPQGYQLIVVDASRCIILFKDPRYNEAPNVIQLVKH